MSFEKAIKSLWKGSCTVTVKGSPSTDETTGRTVKQDIVTVENEPCRLSYGIKENGQLVLQEGAYKTEQTATLFISPDVNIPEGSIITVTQNGKTETYTKSGKAKMYSSHSEIPIELKEEWC